MDFARKQLQRYGWKEGKGLGKSEDGISEPLKPKLKFDNSGIGHDVGAQFTNNWWERIFNSAASNINVRIEENGVKLGVNDSESIEISTRNYSLKQLHKNKNLEYGSFLKTAKLTGAGIENFEIQPQETVIPLTSLTDEELLAACEGRTGHKGARHGLKLSGKLCRLEKQEKMLLKKMKNVSLMDDTSGLEKKIKKLKKHKEDVIENTDSQEFEIMTSPSTKKIKNKRKSVTFNSETVVKYYTPDLDTSFDSNKDENSNNAATLDPSVIFYDEGIEQDIEDDCSEQNDTHRSFEEAQGTFSDLSKAERKKLKKKRKLEKKRTASVQFIEEVREQMYIEDNSKKRKLVTDELDAESKQSQTCSYSENFKKKKYVPEKLMRKKEKKREKKMMKSILASMDHFCKISGDE